MGQFSQWNIYWRILAIKFLQEPKIALPISWRTESESGYVWTGKFDLNTDTCGRENFLIRGIKVRSHCHFNKVWQRYSCDNGKEMSAKSALCVQVFFVYQSNLLNAFFQIFSFPTPSSWLLELASSVTMQNNSWYATISLVKTRRFNGKRATKTTSAATCQQDQ